MQLVGVEERGHLLVIGDFAFEIPVYIFTEEDKERVRLGYVCLKCLEPHPQPWPERCKNDGFPMRELQSMLFEKLYLGEVDVGPQTTLADEFEFMTDWGQRKQHNPNAQIWVPGDG